MANIISSDMRIIKSSPFERIQQIYNDRLRSIRAQQPSINRGIEAWKYYFAQRGDQWPAKELAVLSQEDRIPYQYNILSPKLDTMAGAIITDLSDPGWEPSEGEKTTATEAISDTYYQDKEMTDWESALRWLIIGGLIHSSWVEMVETKKYNPSGNIGLEHLREGSFVPDSYWIHNSDKFLRKGWKSQYFTAEGMAFKYQKKSPTIERAIADQQKHGRTELSYRAPEERQRFIGKVGDEYEVIEEMWLEIIKTKRLVGRREGEIKLIPFPIGDDEEYLKSFGDANGIDWDTVKPEPYDDIIYHTTAICPSLDPTLILNDEKPRVQVKRLPVFHFTTKRHNGRNKGLAESIMDMQTTINKRINLESNLIEKTNGGSTIWNENLFHDEKEKNKFLANANKVGFQGTGDLDSVKNIKEDIGPSQFPSQVMAQIELILNTLLPLVSGVSDAWSAESASNDSGVLYERKVQMNKIGTLIMDKQVKEVVNNIGEAYYYQWMITYAKLPREISKKGGKGKIILNERLEDGSIKNGVIYTPRCKVIVIENVNSPLNQTRKQAGAIDALEKTNAETNPLTYQNQLGIFMLNIPQISNEEKEEFKEGLALEKAVAKTTLINRISQNIAEMSSSAVVKEQNELMLAKMGMGRPQQSPQEQITSPTEQINQVPQEQIEEGEFESVGTETGEMGI